MIKILCFIIDHDWWYSGHPEDFYRSRRKCMRCNLREENSTDLTYGYRDRWFKIN